MTLEELLAAATARITRYTPEEALAASGHDALILDIRAEDARARAGVIPGAHHVPRTVLEWRVASTEWSNPELLGRRLILVCDHGYSSILAAATLVDLGIEAGDVVGGFAGWVRAGLPTTASRQPDGVPGMGPPD